MPMAAKLGDVCACPMGGPVPIASSSCGNVVIEGQLAARVSDVAACSMGPETISTGEATVLAAGLPVARQTDLTSHGGAIVTGAATVLVGEGSAGPAAAAPASVVGAASNAEPGEHDAAGARGADERPSRPSADEFRAGWDELVEAEPAATDEWRKAAEADGKALCPGEAPDLGEDFACFAALWSQADRLGIGARQALYRALPHRFRAFDLWFPDGMPAPSALGPGEEAGPEPAADEDAAACRAGIESMAGGELAEGPVQAEPRGGPGARGEAQRSAPSEPPSIPPSQGRKDPP